MRILLVEDDKKIFLSLSKGLKSLGYALDHAVDGEEGEELASINEYDAILLDVMLPNQNGWTTCANLRKANILTPILMLTALDDVSDKIKGLNSGADDYLAKPFHFGELEARIRSLIRRRTDVRTAIIEKYGVTLDTATHHVSRDGQSIKLTSKEFALLEYFMMNSEKVLTREQISNHLWDMNFEPRSNVIEAAIKFLRKKIDLKFTKSLIHTVRGTGYIFSNQDTF